MSLPLTPTDLQKPDVLRTQRREWVAERTGWAVFAIVMALGALGGFGGGPLAHASRSTGAVHLGFDRFVRHGVPTNFRLAIGPEAGVDNRITVGIDLDFLGGAAIQDIRPTPLSSSSSDDRLTLEFAAPASLTSIIVIEIKPGRAGQRSGWIEVGNRGRLEFEQIVFP